MSNATPWYKQVSGLIKGLGITLRHFFRANNRRQPVGINHPEYFFQPEGLVTLNYPQESLPTPDKGRYRLHNEMDDCIVCDLCAKVCPVNCITIESVKATEEIGITSDGTKKRLYAPVFDIDMAKCCFCGLCTTVCPTDCLTMTNVYDFPEVDIKNMIYHFTDLSPEQAQEKRDLLEKQQAEIAKAKAEAKAKLAQKGGTGN